MWFMRSRLGFAGADLGPAALLLCCAASLVPLAGAQGAIVIVSLCQPVKQGQGACLPD